MVAEVGFLTGPGWDGASYDATEMQKLRASIGPEAEKAAQEEAEGTALFMKWCSERKFTLAQLREIPPPTPLVGGNILFTGTNSWLVGQPGTYKSFFALDWACCIASGTAWLGREVKRGKVLYLTLEASSGIAARVDAWLSARRVDESLLDGQLDFIRRASAVDPIDRAMLARDVAAVGYSLVVIDTQARFVPGVNENDKHEMDAFVTLVTDMVQDTGTTTLSLHHTPKSGESPTRGSGSLEGASDTLLWLKKSEPLKVELEIFRQKETESGESWFFDMEPEGDSIVASNATGQEEIIGRKPLSLPTAKRLQMAALSALEDAGTHGLTKNEIVSDIKEIAEKLGVPKSRATLYRVAEDLLELNLAYLDGGVGEAKRGARVLIMESGRRRLRDLVSGPDGE